MRKKALTMYDIWRTVRQRAYKMYQGEAGDERKTNGAMGGPKD